MINGRISYNPSEHEDYLVSLLLCRSRAYLAQDALKKIEPDDFCSPMFQDIWKAARSIAGEGRIITREGIRRWVLTHSDRPTGRTGQQAMDILDRQLDAMASAFPAVDHAAEAIDTVRDMAQRRRLHEAAQRVVQRIAEAEDVGGAAAAFREEMELVEKHAQPTTGVRTLHEMLPEFEEMLKGGPTSPIIPTPWDDFNALANGGLSGGRMYVCGGRPGDGKSNVGLVLTASAAAEGHKALIFSAEMAWHEVVARVVARNARVELNEINRYDMRPESWYSYQEFKQRAADMPLRIVDTPSIGINYIKTIAREEHTRNGLDVLFVDYLQLLKSDSPKLVREQQVAEISRELKGLARELDVSVIVAAQLNRGAADREPTKSDLRESGAIEQDADLVMLLHHARTDEGEPTGYVTLIIDKNRHGRCAKIILPWRGHYASIG